MQSAAAVGTVGRGTEQWSGGALILPGDHQGDDVRIDANVSELEMGGIGEDGGHGGVLERETRRTFSPIVLPPASSRLWESQGS